MKHWKDILIVVLFIGLAIALVRGCQEKTRTVIVPEKSGEFEPQEPVYLPGEVDTVYLTKWRTNTETIEVITENPVNDSLVSAYQNVKDSLERFKLYLDAVQIRQFRNTFEDEYLKANVSGEVQGKLNYVSLDYIRKEIEVKTPTYHRILAGAEIGNNTSFNDFRYKVNLSLQTPKGNIYKVSYSKQFGEDYIWLGYEASLFRF